MIESKGNHMQTHPPVAEMSEREMLEEIVEWQRTTTETVNKFLSSLSGNPMFRTMLGRFGT